MFNLKFKKLDERAVIPQYQSKGAAGFDFHALEDTFIVSGEIKIVRTGLAVEIPWGLEMQIRPRSGLSLKTGLRIANAPGTVDSDYRGEIGIIMENKGKAMTIKAGERIAQGVICFVARMDIEEVDELSDTGRGTGGYGSTGK